MAFCEGAGTRPTYALMNDSVLVRSCSIGVEDGLSDNIRQLCVVVGDLTHSESLDGFSKAHVVAEEPRHRPWI